MMFAAGVTHKILAPKAASLFWPVWNWTAMALWLLSLVVRSSGNTKAGFYC
jgi:hypothetical protein